MQLVNAHGPVVGHAVDVAHLDVEHVRLARFGCQDLPRAVERPRPVVEQADDAVELRHASELRPT
eukprot:scaffold137035_cov190-Phaeocystis_antarctica.AAC.1